MANLYLDTNIYIDYYQNRNDNMLPLGEFAFNLMKRAISCEFFIFYSDLTEKELCKVYDISGEECFNRFFKDIDAAGKLVYIELTKPCYDNAKKISNESRLHFADALHLSIAEENRLILVTRDKHFSGFDMKTTILKPEEL